MAPEHKSTSVLQSAKENPCHTPPDLNWLPIAARIKFKVFWRWLSGLPLEQHRPTSFHSNKRTLVLPA